MRIAFTSLRSGNQDIWVMDASPTATATPLVTNSAIDNQPDW
jgi:Tol biopolymer transport system component